MSLDILQAKIAEPNKDERKWELCAALAEDLLASDELPPEQKAYASWSLCRSLSNLERYTEALQPGQAAVVLAEQVRDYDLLGRSLFELAYVQWLIPGQQLYAIENLQRFIQHAERYSPDLRERLPDAFYNLGIYERAAIRHAEALEHFRQAWEAPLKAKDSARRERYRQDYCWQALLMEDLPLAEQLLAHGEEYLRLYPGETTVEAHYISDKARYAHLKGDQSAAIGYAMEAISRAHNLSNVDVLTDALVTWSLALERVGDLDSALAIAQWAHTEAQRSQRPEQIAAVKQILRRIPLRDPESINRLMQRMTRPANQ